MLNDNKKIKLKNYENIYSLFFENNEITKSDVVEKLNLSLPTVLSNISKLEKEGLISLCKTLESRGGRPASAYKLVKDAYVAIGVELSLTKVRCAVIDLTSRVCFLQDFDCLCEDSKDYEDSLVKVISSFLQQINYKKNQILGVGISIEAIVDKDCESILYSKILPIKKLSAKDLSEKLGFEVKIYHDVECAASTELWHSNNISDAIYVSLSNHLGGAIIQNHHIEHGKKGFAGALEHIQLDESGPTCYCGKKGCLETYCSLESLLKNEKTIDQFFKQVRKDSSSDEAILYDRFLKNLAKGLYTVYLLLERQLILGGKMSLYITQEDIDKLENLIIDRSTFNIEKGFIQKAKIENNAAVTGCALSFISKVIPKSIIPVTL